MINRIIISTPYPPPRQVFSPGLATTEAQVHTHILDSALEILIEHCLLINKNRLDSWNLFIQCEIIVNLFEGRKTDDEARCGMWVDGWYWWHTNTNNAGPVTCSPGYRHRALSSQSGLFMRGGGGHRGLLSQWSLWWLWENKADIPWLLSSSNSSWIMFTKQSTIGLSTSSISSFAQ